eukprot:TRINITY_DN7631_c0_g1_i2.p1 TRINITY_DN7631_c0_g1~~TRINITY_DN7631_c0_g1_i2.p1  ORF type:complete len:230 (-),score=53.42 TRINITY_DN7631_c0_g1_i2:107-751(-)
MAQEETIGFVGIGNMGIGIARNLMKYVQYSYSQKVIYFHNRTKDAPNVLSLSQDPAFQWCESTSEVAAKSTILFTILANDNAILQTAKEGIIGVLKPGSVHIDMSTIHPDTSSELQSLHMSKGSLFLSCPVFGRPDAAAAAKLWVLAAGDQATIDRVTPLLNAIGEKLIRIGPDSKAALALKLIGNMFILSNMQTMAGLNSYETTTARIKYKSM